jgi:hypothetical protein
MSISCLNCRASEVLLIGMTVGVTTILVDIGTTAFLAEQCWRQSRDFPQERLGRKLEACVDFPRPASLSEQSQRSSACMRKLFPGNSSVRYEFDHCTKRKNPVTCVEAVITTQLQEARDLELADKQRHCSIPIHVDCDQTVFGLAHRMHPASSPGTCTKERDARMEKRYIQPIYDKYTRRRPLRK